jgi:hypothetical protein
MSCPNNNRWCIRHPGVIALLVTMALTHSAWASGTTAGISVRLDPPRISTGDVARLTVSLFGSSAGQPELPTVEGLEIVPAGRSSQVQMINGAVSTSQTFSFLVIASREGRYDIPPVEARVDGVTQRSAPITLQVVKDTGRAPATSRSPALGHAGSRVSQAVSPDEVDRVAFLRLHLGKTAPRIGETVPVQIKAYFQEGVQAELRALPELSGNAFTLQRLSDKPQQSREVVGNHRYTVLTWYTGMSAIKEGEYPVGAKLEATLLIPERSQRGRSRGRGSSLFGFDPFDTFFSDNFFGRVQERDITLVSTDEAVFVSPLPAEGRPEHFNGAVGRFQVSVDASPKKVAVGDPVNVRVEVTGYGNFDRVTQPRLTSEDGLRVYEPTTSFDALDAIGYQGVKTFEYVVIPRDASLKGVPPLQFSFFDPDRATYETVTTRPIPLLLTAIPGASHRSARQKPPSADGEAAFTGQGQEATELGHVVGGPALLHHELGAAGGHLRPVLSQPWFGALLAAFGLPLVLGLVLRRRRERIAADPNIVRKQKAQRAVAAALARMERAVRSGDVAAFFDASCSAVRQRLGFLWAMEPQAITWSDIRHRLPDATGILEVFATADAVAYSGQPFSHEELVACRNTLRKEMKSLGDHR